MAGKSLNTTAASLLGMLHDGPLSGWDLVAKAEDEIGAFWSITRSQVYRELKVLAEHELILPGRTGARERRPYSLTDKGRAAFREWLETKPGTETIRYPLLLRLRFGRFISLEAVAALIDEARVEHAASLKQYLAERSAAESATANGSGASGADPSGVDDFSLAVLDLGIRYEQAFIDWIDNLPAYFTDATVSPET